MFQLHPLARRLFLVVSGALALTMCGDEGSEVVSFIDLRAEGISDSGATIRFETSRPTTCEVEYGVEIGTLDGFATDPTMGANAPFAIDHNVPLSDLQPETAYYYRGRATDGSGRTYRSEIQTFTTSAAVARPENVALLSRGATVVGVSSNFGGGANDSVWGANNAFDGQSGTEWATNGDGDDAWVEIELPAATSITGLGFRSRRMSDGSSIITSLQLTFDGTTTAGPFETPDPATFYLFDVTPTSASRVRIEAITTTGGNAGAKEIELYAE